MAANTPIAMGEAAAKKSEPIVHTKKERRRIQKSGAGADYALYDESRQRQVHQHDERGRRYDKDSLLFKIERPNDPQEGAKHVPLKR